MIVDGLRVVACPVAHGHWGRAAPIARGGTGLVGWKRNLNLGVTHHSSSPDCMVFCANHCGLLPTCNVLLCAVHLLPMDDSIRKAEKEARAVKALGGFA